MSIHEEINQKEKLASLGKIDIEPLDLTLGKLNDLLRQLAHKLTNAPPHAASTMFGWACSGDRCAAYASFPITPEKEVPLSSTPAFLWVSDVGFGKPFQGSIGGIHLGDSVDVLRTICLRRGHEANEGPGRILWDKDWKVAWIESGDHKVKSLMFFNMPLLNAKRAQVQGEAIENHP